MMTMLATFQAKRSFRWAIALILIILEVVLWVLLIGLPWVSFEIPNHTCKAPFFQPELKCRALTLPWTGLGS